MAKSVEKKGIKHVSKKSENTKTIPSKEVASVSEKEAKAVAVGILVLVILVAVVICILVASKANKEKMNEMNQGVIPTTPKQEEQQIDVKELKTEAIVENKTLGNMIFQNITLAKVEEETKLTMQVENTGNDSITDQSVYFVFLNDKGEEISRTLVELPTLKAKDKAMITLKTWIDIFNVFDMKVEQA